MRIKVKAENDVLPRIKRIKAIISSLNARDPSVNILWMSPSFVIATNPTQPPIKRANMMIFS
ncbi:MAG TPA: hypothetical protein VK213_02195 [Bacteroidales bacterium]|nr:hypothetical protein [Bacteroidales bacterium]